MDQNPKLSLTRTRDFGDLITDCFAYVREHYKVLGKSILYFVVPIIVVSSIFFGSYMQEVFSMMPANPGEGEPVTPDFSSLLPSLGGASLFGLFAWSAMAVVVYSHMSLVASNNQQEVTVDHIWQRYKKDIWGILGISILTGIFTFLGALFLIIPGIFLSVKFTLIPAAYINERTGISDAFSRSWHLTKNYWWYTFGLVILMSIMVSFMSYFLTVPIMIVSAFTQFAGGEAGSSQSLFAIVYGAAMVLGYIFYALFYISLGLHYFNLIERKEGSAMKERIEQINT